MKKLLSWIASGLITFSISATAAEPDWTEYAQVLEKYVQPGEKNGVSLNTVNYEALKKNGGIDRVAAQLADYPADKLATREEKLSFYINAYNVLAMKTVLDHWPVKSIKDIGSFISPVWDKPAGKLGGKVITLGELEHKVLRPMGEPRVHFAIVCASVSCPDLRAEPYTAAHLSMQLDDQTKRFLDNPAKGLKAEQDAIKVSRIFDWFKEDFSKSGGVEVFVKRYHSGLPSNLPVKPGIAYDWGVNAPVK